MTSRETERDTASYRGRETKKDTLKDIERYRNTMGYKGRHRESQFLKTLLIKRQIVDKRIRRKR